MFHEVLIFISSIWQEQAAAVAYYLAGKPMWEALGLLTIGASLGVTFFYFFPEEISLIAKVVRKLFKKLKLYFWPNSIQSQPKNNTWLKNRIGKIQNTRQKLAHKFSKSNYPQIAIFIIAAIPIPGLIPLAVAISRIINLRRGLVIIILATFLRTFILTIVVYEVGGIFAP